MLTDIPVVVTIQGAQPTPPADLLSLLIALVSATTPGYTVNLPGSLIEDISSTDVGALIIIDSARVELLNSLSPFVANAFMLSQLGQVYLGPGTSVPASPTNTSVFVQFTGTPGFVIPPGFTVSDGVHQYVVQDGGVVGSGGLSQLLFCLGTVSGSWAVPTGTVTVLVTSVPTTVSLAVTNPVTGVPGAAAETEAQYRTRVLQAGLAIGDGTQTRLKTLLAQVPNVQARLISVVQQANGFWEIICGGGDPYFTADAIYRSGVNVALLQGAILNITGITKATNGLVTTATNHGYSPGQATVATGIVGMTALNGLPLTVLTTPTEKTFTINVDTSGFAAYVSGGVLTPNLNNIEVSLNDYPNIYTVNYVNPAAQTVQVGITWQTISTNFVSSTAIAQAAQQPIADYLNSIVGGAPISLLVVEQVFLAAIASILPASLVSSLVIAVTINNVPTPPTGDLVYGDPQSFFEATAADITVSQAP